MSFRPFESFRSFDLTPHKNVNIFWERNTPMNGAFVYNPRIHREAS